MTNYTLECDSPYALRQDQLVKVESWRSFLKTFILFFYFMLISSLRDCDALPAEQNGCSVWLNTFAVPCSVAAGEWRLKLLAVTVYGLFNNLQPWSVVWCSVASVIPVTRLTWNLAAFFVYPWMPFQTFVACSCDASPASGIYEYCMLID